MPVFRHLRSNDYTRQPWKNGQGETREIARDELEWFEWRLSWATIPASGPFSLYPGYDRTLILLDGGPVKLVHVGEREKLLRPLEAYQFRGEWETRAEAAAPAEDFNLFVRRGSTRARVEIAELAPGEERRFSFDGREHFLFVVRGEIDVIDPNSNHPTTLVSRETFRVFRAATEMVPPLAIGSDHHAACLWIAILPRGG
jgi:environmental stress-induced protein Ves